MQNRCDLRGSIGHGLHSTVSIVHNLLGPYVTMPEFDLYLGGST